MIYLYTGVPGAGKTLFCLRDMYDFWKADAIKKCKELKIHEGEWPNHARPVYVARVKDLAVPGWQLLEKSTDWHTCPVGSIIMLDECQEDFPPRPNGSAVPEHVARIADHRHKAQDLFLVTQHPSSIDNFVRRRVEQTNWVLRKFGSKLTLFFSWPGVCEAPEKSKNSGFKRERLYPKEVFAWYKSAEAHTHQFKLPREAYYFGAAILAIPLAFFALYHVIGGLGFKGLSGVTPGQVEEGVKKEPVKAPEPPKPADPLKTYLTAYTPRLDGLPHTAPAYDGMTQPTRVPVPAACVDIRNKCTCYTQDATRIVMDEGLCRQIVASGYFVQFNTEREQRRDRMEQGGTGAARGPEDRPAPGKPGFSFPENDNYIGVTNNGAAVLTYDRPRGSAQVAQAAPGENVAGPVIPQAQGLGRGRTITSQ